MQIKSLQQRLFTIYIAVTIANIFNDALQHHELLDIGKGVLILVQKPGKPTGPLTSLRPIVLLSVLRKTLSLIVLSRIAPKVDEYLSSSQSGFRRGRSTADVVFGYRWLCAKAQRHRVTVKFLGIDLSRAFDTIRRDKLLDTLQTFVDESELRMIRFLLVDTSLQPRISTGDCLAFATTIGTPQGDSLSPVLFTVYLEAALRDLRPRLPMRPPEDAALPLDVEYADDTDFISTSRSFLDDIERIAPPCLAEWSLTINGSKTERTSISRHADRIEEEWRMTRKLGSLLGEAEDVARRKQLANVAFRKLMTVWFRRAHISLHRPPPSSPVIGVHWPNRISNVALYHRCQCRPISESIVTARWRLFGHVLRVPRDAPAQRAIDHYFADTEAAAFRGRPRTSLPTTLCSDLRRIGRTLRQPTDIEALRALSREQWRQMERDISA